MKLIESPINYMGSKYKLLERLIIIKDLSDLKNISNSISEVSYNDGIMTQNIISKCLKI